MRAKWLLAALVILGVLTACQGGGTQGMIVKDPWVRPSPMIAGNGAGYLVIQNRSGADDALIGARADFADAVEIHESYVVEQQDAAEDGMGEMEGVGEMMGMRPVDAVPVPAGGEVVLEPGGYHIMFIGINEMLEPGTTVTFTLVFESGLTLEVEAEVRAQ
ncbi:MAG: copper chaperone PCu(A)C [Anaerolineae bacterium]